MPSPSGKNYTDQMGKKFQIGSLLEHVLAPFDNPGSQGHKNHENYGHSEQARRERGTLAKRPLDEAEDAVARHRMGHQALQVIGDREPFQVSRERQRHLLPSEDEDQADDQRPFELAANEREQGPIDRQPQREERQVLDQVDE